MREYIAIVMRQRKLHLIMVVLMFIFALFWAILTAHSDWVAGWLRAFQNFLNNL